MRLLAGILAGQPFATTITETTLRARPMPRCGTAAFDGAGVDVAANGGAPLHHNRARPLRSIHYRLRIASAQIKSAILLAGLGGRWHDYY